MRAFVAIISLFVCFSVFAQNLLPNPSFETGVQMPGAWQLKEGTGKWETSGHSGKHCLSVTGDGANSNYWFTPAPQLTPGGTYRFSFWSKLLPGTSGGCLVSGPSYCNHDAGSGETWRKESFIFCSLGQTPDAVIRLGQWSMKGTALFDDVELRSVLPVHSWNGNITLGAGEQINGDIYTFKTAFSGSGSNYSRLLEKATAGFNSSRWVFSPGTEVIYKQEIPGVEQTKAQVNVMIGWYASGVCLVQASRDQRSWTSLGELRAVGSGTFAVPEALLPAQAIYVRLLSPGQGETGPDFAPGSFQVYHYSYQAHLARSLPDMTGTTNYIDVERDTGQVTVDLESLGSLLPGPNQVWARIASKSGSGTVRLVAQFQPGGAVAASGRLEDGQPLTLRPRYNLRGAGDHTLRLTVSLNGKSVWEASTSFTVASLHASDYGYLIKSATNVDLWWCEGTYKISQTRDVPQTVAPVRLAAARNEYEPCQVILRPKQDLRNVTATVSEFHGPNGTTIPAERFTVRQVEYLKVTTPTDSSSCEGWWPDPLPPFTRQTLRAGRNWPLWLTVKVPQNARAGLYKGTLALRGDGFSADIPVQLQVFDFTMPSTPHLQTAWGFSFGRVQQYQNLTSLEDRQKVYDLCLQDFREHRIAPYSFSNFAPIKVEVQGINWSGGQVVAGGVDGTKCLRIVDASDRAVVAASAAKRLPITKGTAYRFAWAVKTAKPDQDYQITLGCFDASGKWLSGRNIDLVFKGNGDWQKQELTLSPNRFPQDCVSVDLTLRPAPWTEQGEHLGSADFDAIFFGTAGGENLVSDPSFETSADDIKVAVDFTEFDKAAERYLNDYGFSTFVVPLQFLGGGRYPTFYKGRIGPYEEGTPEYDRLFHDYAMQLQNHIEQKGWLDKAFIYCYDEPAPADYDFCRGVFERLKRDCPKLRRMLTVQPVSQLEGVIDIWNPVSPNYNRTICQERQKLGETIWWYVCTGPKAPYCGLFIDHGATELRTWIWQTWQNKITGTLIWETTWWNSAYAPHSPQNPWVDPMGWTPEGGYWGNGDGRFLYPANRDYPNDKRPYVEAPVDSLRWEMLREGLEDYEYLYLLREAVNRKLPGAKAYASLLEVPREISVDLTHFAREPQPIYAHRAKLAAALEKLQVDKMGIK